MFVKGSTAIEGLSGRGKAIFSLEATSTFEAGGTVGFETFSGDGGATFSLGATFVEGGVLTWAFSGWETTIFSFGVTSG
jgi:hypothetical protein